MGGAVTRITTSAARPDDFEPAQSNRDLVGELLEDWVAPLPELCMASCARKLECEGFAFYGNRCYLKGGVNGTYENAGRITRVKQGVLFVAQSNRDLVGELLVDWFAPLPELCMASCARKPECEGFAFYDDRCYLKADVQETSDNPGRIAGVKRGVLPNLGGRRLSDSSVMV